MNYSRTPDNDLISRSALLEFAKLHTDGKIDCNDIARFPNTNTKPVRHGVWIRNIHSFFDTYRCSACSRLTAFVYQNYCPNCGCKMDGDENG